MKRIGLGATVLALCGTCLVGCKAAQPQSFDQALEFFRAANAEAAKYGVAATADVELGPFGVGQETRFYLDHGVRLRIHLQGDADATVAE